MKAFPLGIHKPFLLVIFFVLASTGWSLRMIPNHDKLVSLQEEKTTIGDKEDGAKKEMGMKVYPSGSGLPDCSHACGPCFPCKRVMVSFKCFTESCPIVYKCMCKGKYYHVPSN